LPPADVRFLSFLLPSIGAPIFTLHIAIPGLTHWYKPYDFVFTWAQPLAVVWLIVMTGINTSASNSAAPYKSFSPS